MNTRSYEGRVEAIACSGTFWFGAAAFVCDRFTGKERDTESNLDCFGARYYSSTMGRWMSPDWSATPEPIPYADLSDPQTLNLFPNFMPHAVAEVQVDGLTGDYPTDAKMANQAAGLSSTPDGYVWHHVEDGKTMQLVPKNIHESVRHTGGAAVIRNGGVDDK